MRGLVRRGVLGADGTVWGDWGGVTAGEGREGLPSASFPFSLCRGGQGGGKQGVQQKHMNTNQSATQLIKTEKNFMVKMKDNDK